MKVYLIQSRRRRGGVYIFVLGSSMMVSLIGLTVLTLAQVNSRSIAQSNDVAEASVLAESAVELGLAKIQQDTSWQTDYPTGVATTPVGLGHGTISFKWASTSSPSNSVRVYGIGKVHNATRIYSMQMSAGASLTSLQTAGGATTLSLTGALPGGATISAGSGGITAGGATFSSATTLESVGSISPGGTITNVTKVTLSSARTMPDTTHVFDTYKAVGTQIPITSLPLSVLTRQLKWVLLAPGVNSMASGPTNSLGIYYIDCLGATIQIQNCRVLGTLVILNPGAGSVINGSVYFAPATAGYPSLLIKGGSVSISPTVSTLSDSSVNSVNFNQAGAPYSGTTDTTFTTTYPCRFEGIVYSSGSLSISNVAVQGVLLANGTLTVNSSVTLTYDPASYNNPPPGFTSSSVMSILGGTWQWETGP